MPRTDPQPSPEPFRPVGPNEDVSTSAFTGTLSLRFNL